MSDDQAGMGGLGGLDLGALMQQAQAMQEQVMAAQEEQAAQTVTGSAGGGKIMIEATGGGEFRKVTIHPDAVDPNDIELLEELMLAALHDTTSQIAELQEDSMGSIGLPDMGSLGGMLGLGADDDDEDDDDLFGDHDDPEGTPGHGA